MSFFLTVLFLNLTFDIKLHGTMRRNKTEKQKIPKW